MFKHANRGALPAMLVLGVLIGASLAVASPSRPSRVAARRPMPAAPEGPVGRAAAAPRPAPADRKDPAPGRAARARPTPARTTTARPRATTTGRARTAEAALALRDRLARPRQTL